MNANTAFCDSDWLIRIFREVDGTLTLEQALHAVMEQMKDFLDHKSLAVLTIDENTDAMTFRSFRGISYSFVKTYHHTLSGQMIPRVLLKHETVCMNAPRAHSPEYEEIKLEHDFQYVCLAPLIQNQRAIGYVHCDRDTDPFTDSEIRNLEIIGYVIGLVMEKFELLKLTHHLSRIDEVSKALKYQAFLEEYRREIARAKAYKSPLTLLLLDIDDYPAFMATCGIEAGHTLLRNVHDIILEHIKEIDLVGRFSADEFIICMGGVLKPEAENILNAIRQSVQERAAANMPGRATLCGVAMTLDKPEDLNTPLATVLSALGSRLLSIRTAGPNRIACVPPPRE